MEFNFNEWKVDLIQEPNVLLKTLKEFNIKGKKIKNIRILGNVFDLIDGLEEEIYKKTENKNDSDVENFKDDYEFKRIVEIDDPIIITFEDNDRLEIDYSEGSSIKIGLNSLPENIESKNFINNLDGNVMFSNCIGKSIIGFQVSMQDDYELTWDFTGSYGIELPENQDAYISEFRILLSDSVSIVFKNFYDYGHVWTEDWLVDISTIKWEELKKGIKENNKKQSEY